jgi:hypothetical protein
MSEKTQIHKNPKVQDAAARCLAKTCKKDPAKFGFCNEHYEHFKFGLIRKDGHPALDYEKKMDQFAAYQHRLQAAASAHTPAKKAKSA